MIHLCFWLLGLSFNNCDKIDAKALDYIEQYKEIAVIEMYRTGVPASITIAQALHESNYGNSPLAVKANNHFGIKCKSYWSGETYYHKDDDKDDKGKLINSCFRAYNSSLDSYVDHSNFLKYGENYVHLFDLSLTDYVGWAYGLKAGGYATDPHYAEKLIRNIEKYKLFELDSRPNPYKKVKTF